MSNDRFDVNIQRVIYVYVESCRVGIRNALVLTIFYSRGKGMV